MGECCGGSWAECAGGVGLLGDGDDDDKMGGVEFVMLGAAGLGCGGVTRRGAVVVGRMTVSSDTIEDPAVVGAGSGCSERKGNCVSSKTTWREVITRRVQRSRQR